MAKESKKHIEGLYTLIKSMSRTDRLAFEREVLGEEHNYAALFEVLAKSKTLNTNKVIPKVVSSETALYQSSRYLAQKILEWISKKDHSCRWELTLIKKSVKQGFCTIGLNTLRKQFLLAWNQRDLFYLRELHELRSKLNTYYGLRLELPEKIISQGALLNELSIILRAEIIHKKIKAVFAASVPERIEIAKEFSSEVHKMNPDGLQPSSQVKVLKAKEILSILNGEYTKARVIHETIHDLMMAHFNSFSLEEHVDEYTLMVTLMANDGKYEDAEKVVFQIGMLDYESSFQKQKITNGWVYCALVVAAGSAKEDIGKKATSEFEKISHSLSPKRRAILLHFASVVHFYAGRWKEVISLQNRLSRHGKATSENLKASSYLIRAISKYEIGDFEDSLMDISKFENYSLKESNQYPLVVARGMRVLLKMDHNDSSSNLVLANLKKQIDLLAEDKQELPLIWMFDLRPWILSKELGQSVSKTINDRNVPGLVQMKLGS